MSVSIYNNERSLAQDIAITWDAVCKSHKDWKIRALGAEISINATKATHEKGRSGMNFPDLVLYGSESKSAMSILQMWELKCPDVSMDDATFLPQAIRKANYLGLNSTLIWNFQYGCLYIRDAVSNEFVEVKKWSIHPEHIIKKRTEALEFVDLYKDEIDNTITEMFTTVNNYLSTGDIPKRSFTFEGAEYAIQEIINNNKRDTAKEYENAAISNAILEAKIEDWWSIAQKEYSSDETDKYVAYSKQTILNWLQKILFANIVKAVHPKAKDVEKITGNVSIDFANNIFIDITNHIDFFTMFYPSDSNNYLSEGTWDQIKDFNKYIIDSGIPIVNQEAIQGILDSTVSSIKRNVTGLYSEKPSLAEILVGITMIDATKYMIDPCCGTGTISRKAVENKINRKMSVKDTYNTVWSSDYNSFPLQVASLSLLRHDSINIPAIVFRKNIFDLIPGQVIAITNPENGEAIEFKVPKFDYVISNLPFIDFNTVDMTVFPKDQRDIIKKDVYKNTGISLNDKMDIYVYIVFYIWTILADNGRVGVILSNSWLKSMDFFNALSYYYEIDGVYISANGRWFDNADVVATLVILTKKNIIKKTSHPVVFGRILKSIKEIEESNIAKAIVNDILLKKDGQNIVCHKHDLDHIYKITDSGISLNYMFYDSGWYSNIISKTVPINSLFDASRGLKSGCDKVFYVKDDTDVDSHYLTGMLMNSKNVTSLELDTDQYVITCDKDLDELNARGDMKTSAYFTAKKAVAMASQSARANADKNIKNKHPWYSPFAWNIEDKKVDIVIPINSYERIFCGKLRNPAIVNQRLAAFKAHQGVNVKLCHALLNSIFFFFAMEAGANPMALGALDNNSKTLQSLPMLNPALLSEDKIKNILNKFDILIHRPVYSVLEELEMSDREEFDRLVLRSYGIEDCYDVMKKDIIDMITIRLCNRKSDK